jgi:3-oxoacyl-[acyl-carrier-protein] synthase II
VVGSGAGGIDVAERQYGDFFCRGLPSGFALRDSRLHRRHRLERDVDRLGQRGQSHVLSTGCTSSTDAIG